MKQALEALESATPKYTRQRADQKTLGGALDYWKLEQHQRLKAITSLRQAIAEAEKQEPVKIIAYNCKCGRTMKFESEHGVIAPQRTWVGLTDEAIWSEYQTLWPFHPTEEPRLAKDIAKFAHAIEAKLKEKNT